MSEFLRQLAARSLGLAPVVRPRLASMFAPPAAQPRAVGDDDFVVAAEPAEPAAGAEVSADTDVSVRRAPPRGEPPPALLNTSAHAPIAHDDDASRAPHAPGRSLAQKPPAGPRPDERGVIVSVPVEPSAAVCRMPSSVAAAQMPDQMQDSGESRLPLARPPAAQRSMADLPGATADPAFDALQRSSAALIRTPDSEGALFERTAIDLTRQATAESLSLDAAPLNATARTIASATFPDAQTTALLSRPDSTPFEVRLQVPFPGEAARPLAVATSTASAAPAGNAASMPRLRESVTPPVLDRRARGGRNPERTVLAGEQLEPTIHVSIGRVEIRAVPAPAAAPREAIRDERTPSRLETYLRRHAGGSGT